MAIELATTDKKPVITKDGRNVGVMTGCDMSTETWKVDELFVTIPKAIAKDLKVKTGLFKSTAMIKIRTDQVSVVGDVIGLSIDYATLQKHLAS
jgi:sporulation protein YlmC with PRC-barrel domain